MNEGEHKQEIDLSVDHIEIHQPIRQESKSLFQENRFIKKQNEVLRRELEKISFKLDGEIKKRLDSSQKKQVSKG